MENRLEKYERGEDKPSQVDQFPLSRTEVGP